MKILVLGAGGKTGEAVTLLAYQEGYEVTALVYALEPIDFQCAYVRIVRGDALDKSLLRQAMSGQEAVLDTISSHLPFWNTDVEAETACNVIEAMHEFDVRRLIALSSIGQTENISGLPSYYNYLVRPTVRRGVMKDKAEMECEVRSSQLDWTIVRPAPLVDGEPRGFRVIDEEEAASKAPPITRADVARFVVAQISSNQYLNKAVAIVGVE